MKQLNILLYPIFALFMFSSCKEIIAENIEAKLPILLLPSINDTVQVNPVNFKWEAVEGATKYHLEIVSPSFTNLNSFALDTIISGTNFYFALDSNEYELKLTALNAGYKSQTLGPRKFWVGISPQTTNNQVQLNTPVDSVFVNASFHGPFTWQSMNNLASFEFSFRQGTNFSTGNIVNFQNGMNALSTNIPNGITLSEGTYFWGIKAYLTSGAETPFAKRKLLVDTTLPNVPSTPFSPISSSLVGLVTFSWNNGVDNGIIKAPVRSTLQISSDPSFSVIIHSAVITGSSSIVDMTFENPGTYYWNVINTDDAGNLSNYSITNQFILN